MHCSVKWQRTNHTLTCSNDPQQDDSGAFSFRSHSDLLYFISFLPYVTFLPMLPAISPVHAPHASLLANPNVNMRAHTLIATQLHLCHKTSTQATNLASDQLQRKSVILVHCGCIVDEELHHPCACLHTATDEAACTGGLDRHRGLDEHLTQTMSNLFFCIKSFSPNSDPPYLSLPAPGPTVHVPLEAGNR